MTSSISATPLYKVIRRGEPVARVKLDPNLLPLVHLVRDARGCTVRGALELLIKTGFVDCTF